MRCAHDPFVMPFVVDDQPAVGAVGFGARAHEVIVSAGARCSPPPEPDWPVLVVDAGAQGVARVLECDVGGAPSEGKVAALDCADGASGGVVLGEQLTPR